MNLISLDFIQRGPDVELAFSLPLSVESSISESFSKSFSQQWTSNPALKHIGGLLLQIRFFKSETSSF